MSLRSKIEFEIDYYRNHGWAGVEYMFNTRVYNPIAGLLARLKR